MSKETTLVNLDGKHNTLVDINGTNTFFESLVVVTPSKEDITKKYKVGIVSQEELDEGNINTKELTGEYSNTITKDSGDFQNLFLYLQSAEPMKNISVDVATVVLEKKDEKEEFAYLPEQTSSQTLYVKLAIATLVVLFGAYMIQRFYKEK